jgi:DNA (cytosine-5)-methyltransferase 1
MSFKVMRRGEKSFLTARSRPQYEQGDRPVTLVDLFSGCGGLTLGVAEAAWLSGRGLDVRLAMEIEEAPRFVYDANFRSALSENRSDVKERFNREVGTPLSATEQLTAAEVGELDFLVGGPPCQGHSDLNNHTRRRDPKNELYMTMVRAAEVLLPKHVIIENVTGVRRDHKAVLDRACAALESSGYLVSNGLVRLVEIGVPQSRVRHLLLASRATAPDVAKLVSEARVAAARTLKWAIWDLKNKNAVTSFDTAARMSPTNFKRAKHLLSTGKYDLANSLRPPCHRDNPDHRYTAMYGRLNWDAPAHTITTGFGSPGQGRYLHPDEPRTLTPHEAARLQLFPDWFDFSRAKTRTALCACIGNAAPSKLALVAAWDRLRTNAADSPISIEKAAVPGCLR